MNHTDFVRIQIPMFSTLNKREIPMSNQIRVIRGDHVWIWRPKSNPLCQKVKQDTSNIAYTTWEHGGLCQGTVGFLVHPTPTLTKFQQQFEN